MCISQSFSNDISLMDKGRRYDNKFACFNFCPERLQRLWKLLVRRTERLDLVVM
jgi:hypothetical protein